MAKGWDESGGREEALEELRRQTSAREGIKASKRRELWQTRDAEMRCDDGRVLTEGDLVEIIEGRLR